MSGLLLDETIMLLFNILLRKISRWTQSTNVFLNFFMFYSTGNMKSLSQKVHCILLSICNIWRENLNNTLYSAAKGDSL